jgi:hypothetical protein
VFDAYVDSKGRAWLIAFKPFGPVTEPLLFKWHELRGLPAPREDDDDDNDNDSGTHTTTTSSATSTPAPATLPGVASAVTSTTTTNTNGHGHMNGAVNGEIKSPLSTTASGISTVIPSSSTTPSASPFPFRLVPSLGAALTPSPQNVQSIIRRMPALGNSTISLVSFHSYYYALTIVMCYDMV